jgi:hypothetical protein
MHKYATATALAIALITMLDAETASAGHAICPFITGSLSCTCGFRCDVELWNTPSCGTAPALFKTSLCEMPA